MEKVSFKKLINAPREKVWNALWDDANYREWTAVFHADSHAITDNWKKDTKVLFVDGDRNGMVSWVADNRPNEFMSFKHLGEMKDGVEDTTSERVQQWAGSHENYTLNDVNGQTELVVDLDINDEFKGYFMEAFPKAIDKAKEIAER